MPYATVNHCKLWYSVRGNGAPLLQLHGSALAHHNFSAVTPLLSKTFRVIDFDLRGYGLSDRPIQHYDTTVWARDAIGLLDALEIDIAHIHGVSMGGAIAIDLASSHPERVDRLVLNGTYAKNDLAGILAQDVRIAIAEHMGVNSRTLAEMIYMTGFARDTLDRVGPAAIDQVQQRFEDNNRREVFVRACRALRDLDLRDNLTAIGADTLVIGGDEDAISPWHMGSSGAGMAYLCEHIPCATKVVIANCGHAVVSEKPTEYCEIVRAFLATGNIDEISREAVTIE